MKTSESIASLAKALACVQATFPKIPKTKPVSYAGRTFYYADLGEIISVVAPVLGKNGLAVSQMVEENKLYTRVMHESGEWLEGFVSLPDYARSQDLGAALTYLRRYTLCAAIGIQAEEDSDGEESEAPKAKKQITKSKQEYVEVAQKHAVPSKEDVPLHVKQLDVLIPKKEDFIFKVPNGEHKDKPITDLATDALVEMVLKIEEAWTKKGVVPPEDHPNKKFYKALNALISERVMGK